MLITVEIGHEHALIHRENVYKNELRNLFSIGIHPHLQNSINIHTHKHMFHRQRKRNRKNQQDTRMNVDLFIICMQIIKSPYFHPRHTTR